MFLQLVAASEALSQHGQRLQLYFVVGHLDDHRDFDIYSDLCGKAVVVVSVSKPVWLRLFLWSKLCSRIALSLQLSPEPVSTCIVQRIGPAQNVATGSLPGDALCETRRHYVTCQTAWCCAGIWPAEGAERPNRAQAKGSMEPSGVA